MAEPRPITYYNWDCPDDEEPDHETEHRSCVRIIHGNADSSSETQSASEPAVVIDGSGYAARLIVLPTFGCVLHEERE